MSNDPEMCPVRQVLSAVMGKWQILILHELFVGPERFGALKRKIGNISQRVLTEKLRALERDGYLKRTVDPGPPISSTYEITDRGIEIFKRLEPLIVWAAENHAPIVETRNLYDERLG